MGELKMSELEETIERAVEAAARRAIDPVLWDLQEMVKSLHEAVDRLVDEQARFDRMKAEAAGIIQKSPNGQDARP